MDNKYKEKIVIKYSETDQNLALKPYALLNFLQDIASKNAEDKGFGYSYIYPRNYAWFLIKYRMEFIDYPFDIQELTLTTEPRGYNKIFAYRDFELKKGDNVIGRMSSQWSIVDINTRSMANVGEALSGNENMPVYIKRKDDLSFDKIPAITEPDITKEFTVRYNDLDVNGHANNGNYVVWGFEPLSYEFRTSHKIKILDMLFKKEAKFGDKLISQVKFADDKTTIHRMTNSSGDDLCLIKCIWDEI